MQEQLFLTQKDKLGYAEEYIIEKYENPEYDQLLNYSLSNNIEDIETAINARTGHNVDLDKAFWEVNTKLSKSAKDLMNKHQVIYSMTILENKKDRDIIINMRVGEKWFRTVYYEFDGQFISKDFIYNNYSKYFSIICDDAKQKLIRDSNKKVNIDLFIETNIYIKGLGTIKISLSNDFDEILKAYIKQTGNSIYFIEEKKCVSNSKLVRNIKDIMNEYNTNYSFIHYMKGEKQITLIKKRKANKWYTLIYQVKPSDNEKRKYTFSIYYIAGCIAGLLYNWFGIKILPEKYYENIR
jgi:hypothetical protein